MTTEAPEECDNCGTSLAKIEKYGTVAPKWLCPYCANAHEMEENRTLCSLMNVLERRLARLK